MDFETLQKLDKLQVSIDEREFETEKNSIREWQAFDVIIRGRSDEATRRWVRVPAQVQDFHHAEPKRRAVATRYAKELSWLFEELKEIHPGDVECISDHDFYGLLADVANLYLEEHKGGTTASRLLEAVMDEVRRIYR